MKDTLPLELALLASLLDAQPGRCGEVSVARNH